MNTIKNTGLRNIIEQGDIYNYNYYIEDVLSEDLTAEEIEASQAIITSVTPHIKEVFEKLNLLYEKICPLSTQVDELNKSISNPFIFGISFLKLSKDNHSSAIETPFPP